MAAVAPISHEEALDDLGPCLYFLNPDARRQARMAHLLTCTECQLPLKQRMEADHLDGVPACSLALIAKREIAKDTITDASLVMAVEDHFETCMLHQKPGASSIVLIASVVGLAVIILVILYLLFFR